MAPLSSKLALEYGYVHQAIPVFRKSSLAQFIFLCFAAYSIPTPESIFYTILYVTAISVALFFIIINRQEGSERASELEKIEPNFMDFATAMEDQRGFFQTDVRSQSDAIRLCSSTVIMHCLASKQKAEALYSVALEASRAISSSDLFSIRLDLGSQKSHMESLIGVYMRFRLSLVDDMLGRQLREFEETSQEWVTRMNNIFH
ncbi:hypothetical protein ARMSODRAFT_1006446 [Armillaria solidipes]|uniref:Uncharacterized protein n=1 Tax=Armillaria solidipes TaxID=1076256 RepID=A0A2H3B3Y0_9AGAR|nr:hypothetical protein ARMSODRAFT_1006446 [Armillaria solidipes]